MGKKRVIFPEIIARFCKKSAIFQDKLKPQQTNYL